MMARYSIDSASSRFTVQAFAAGVLAGLGHSPTFAIREFTGELRFEPEALAEASFRMTVCAASLTLVDSVSPKDREEIERRMRQEVLETTRFPEIVWQSTEIQADKVAEHWHRLRLKGELALHGVKRIVAVEGQLREMEGEARFAGQGSLLISAFRIKPVTALAGMIKLKDELKLDFDLVVRKRDE